MVLRFTQIRDENEHTDLSILQENIPDEESRNHSIHNWHLVLGNMNSLLEKG